MASQHTFLYEGRNDYSLALHFPLPPSVPIAVSGSPPRGRSRLQICLGLHCFVHVFGAIPQIVSCLHCVI